MWLPLLCPPVYTPPPCPVPPCPLSSPACQGVQEGQRVPSPLCPGYAARKGKHCVQGEAPCARGGGRTRGNACKGKGCMQGEREGMQASGAVHEQKGHAPFLHPLCPVDQLRKIPCIVLVNKI